MFLHSLKYFPSLFPFFFFSPYQPQAIPFSAYDTENSSRERIFFFLSLLRVFYESRWIATAPFIIFVKV